MFELQTTATTTRDTRWSENEKREKKKTDDDVDFNVKKVLKIARRQIKKNLVNMKAKPKNATAAAVYLIIMNTHKNIHQCMQYKQFLFDVFDSFSIIIIIYFFLFTFFGIFDTKDFVLVFKTHSTRHSFQVFPCLLQQNK